jgi:hypothetical protein
MCTDYYYTKDDRLQQEALSLGKPGKRNYLRHC